MAKLVGGPLGSYRGKAGGTIGTSWKGIPVVKAMPLSVANPDTVLQQAQRGRFSQCVAVARLLLSDLITPYWNPFSKRMSGYNAFIRQNINAFTKNGLSAPYDFYASRGILKGIQDFTATSAESDENIQTHWAVNSGQGDALDTDIPIFVYYNETQNVWKFKTGGQTRSKAGEVIPDNTIKEDDEIHLWAFFIRPDVSKISDSTYLYVVVTA